MNDIRALIIDDEPLAQSLILSLLEEVNGVVVIGVCSNGFDGFKQLNEQKPDLLFLDVMMPKLTGFEMLELVDDPPVVIFSTAYDEYAIQAFEKNAVDYLLKPYSKERFTAALEKAKQKIASKQTTAPSVHTLVAEQREHSMLLDRIAVRNGSKIHIFPLEAVRYLEAQDDYVKIHTAEGGFLKQLTMKYCEAHLPPGEFLRIHRSYIVRIQEIARIEPFGKDTHVAILHDGVTLSVSRSGYGKLKKALNI